MTTGQLLCACVGSRVRAEYTVFGDAINLAARLMVAASTGGQAVLCDFRTRELARGAASFVALEPMIVKVSKFPTQLQRQNGHVVLLQGPMFLPSSVCCS